MRAEGLLFLYGLESNPESSLQLHRRLDSLEADTRLEPGPGVGTLLGPWEDITRPLEGKGLPRTRCPLSVQAPAPRQSIIHSTHRGPTHVGSEPALGDTAEDEMDEMSSYRSQAPKLYYLLGPRSIKPQDMSFFNNLI